MSLAPRPEMIKKETCVVMNLFACVLNHIVLMVTYNVTKCILHPTNKDVTLA